MRKLILLTGGFFLLSRFFNLLILPIFADEAIYIRWAQMITHDPGQYLFLPLYDGKSPLFMWLLVPLLKLFQDPLLASRLLSTTFGLMTLVIIPFIARAVSASKRAQFLSALFVVILPFPLFFDRMGLIDAMLTSFLAVSFWLLVEWKNHNYHWPWIIGSGISWGLALMTKTSGLYYLLVPAVFLATNFKNDLRLRKPHAYLPFFAAGFIGLCFLAWMRISPLFPFLFNRSSDFAFTPREIFTEPTHILSLNLYRIGKWLLVYLTPGFAAAIGAALIVKIKNRQAVLTLLLYCSLFLLPFLLTGRLLSSRYFLPVVIWLIPAMAISIDGLLHKAKVAGITSLVVIGVFSVRFALPLLTNPGTTPLAHEDDVQYLTEWSSGYGIPEVRDYLKKEAQTKRVSVATEGFFGTLPDGLYVYFDGSPLQKNLEIFGIGQPISGISDKLLALAADHDTYLVVNQHRFLMEEVPPNLNLVASYPRPKNGPSLMLFKINPVKL